MVVQTKSRRENQSDDRASRNAVQPNPWTVLQKMYPSGNGRLWAICARTLKISRSGSTQWAILAAHSTTGLAGVAPGMRVAALRMVSMYCRMPPERWLARNTPKVRSELTTGVENELNMSATAVITAISQNVS